MRHEEIEDSWRPAGFRVIDTYVYLARCNMPDHKCHNQQEPDSPCIEPACPPPPEGLHKELLDLITESGWSQDLGQGLQQIAGLQAAKFRIKKLLSVLVSEKAM